MDEDKNVNQTAKSPNWIWVSLIALVAVVAFGGLYFMNINKSPENINQPQSQQQTSSPTDSTPATTKDNSNQKSIIQITVEGNEFAFSPSTFSVNKGDTVELTFKNMGKYPHNLAISDLSVATKTIQSGGVDTVTFVANKTGSFEYVCTVPGHADKGMTGTLTVK